MKVFVSVSAKKPSPNSVKKAKDVLKQAHRANVEDKSSKLKDRIGSKTGRMTDLEAKLKKETKAHSEWMRAKDKEAQDLQEKLTKIRDAQKDKASKFANKAQVMSGKIKVLSDEIQTLGRQISVLKSAAKTQPSVSQPVTGV